jgi:hypothetical protein
MRVFRLALRGLSAVMAALILAGCMGESVPDGRILIKNDSRDREYNILKVSGGGANLTLAPGQTGLLPKGTQSISFSRQYSDHVKRYRVQCPKTLKSGIVIKLINVHVNRIAGGCTTVSASR